VGAETRRAAEGRHEGQVRDSGGSIGVKGRLSCRVGRDAEDVFDFLADIRNERAWNPRVVRIEKATDGDVGAGTRFESEYKGLGRLDTEIVDYDRPRRLGFRSEGPRMRIAGTFVVSRAGEGTQVDLTAGFQPQGVFRVLAPLMGLVMRQQNKAAAARLTRALARS
jgi:hypothetical protein